MPQSKRKQPQNIIANDPDKYDIKALTNIARSHREHERYHTMYGLARAAQISQEANKLKILADLWLSEKSLFTGPQRTPAPYSVAGCDDLNSPGVVTATGILFMEGEGEPAEIHSLKEKLKDLAQDIKSTARWLSDKMDQAWEREKILFSAPWIDAAWPRFQIILGTMKIAHELAVIGRLFDLALEQLIKIDLRPESIRPSRLSYGKYLRTAGWMLDAAAQKLAECSAMLTAHDPQWTTYEAILNKLSPEKNSHLPKGSRRQRGGNKM